MLAHCQEIHDDDGVDPREYFRATPSRDPINRKAVQLCTQVAETLSLVLAGDFDDELLLNLQVLSVAPAPNASQLAVMLRTDAPPPVDINQIHDRLSAVSGRLRSEVAAAIHRKRAPRLVFHVIAGDARGGECDV